MNKQTNLSFTFEDSVPFNESLTVQLNIIKSTVVPESWKIEFPDCFEKLNQKFKNIEVFDDLKIKNK